MSDSIQAEYGVLAIGFKWLQSLDSVTEYLKPEHFVDPSNAKIYKIMIQALVKRETDVDIVVVHERLKGSETIEHLHSICETVVTGGIQSLAKSIVSKYRERQLFHASQAIGVLAFEGGDIDLRLDKAQAELAKLESKESNDDWVDAYSAAMLHLELIEKRETGTFEGIKTDIYDLDELLDGGLQRGSLFVIGARPAMGKTALGLTLGLSIARDWHVGFLSMEMPHADVRDRTTAILGSMPISTIKRPSKGLQYDRVVDAVERSKPLKFYVSDRGGLNILQVRSKARALKRMKGLDVLVVDYIGLMAGTDSKVSRAYQIEEISKGLKTLAKELDIVVICLAQVNRGAAERGNSVPGLHDLRDSGSIEQDADIVGFIHRPIMAKPELGEQWKDYAQFRIAKNRQGRTGDVNLFYVGEQTKFASWSGNPPGDMTGQSSKKERFE